jgi:hypothetical protein
MLSIEQPVARVSGDKINPFNNKAIKTNIVAFSRPLSIINELILKETEDYYIRY